MHKNKVDMTVKWLNAVEAAPAGKRVDWSDTTKGLGIRVNDKRAITFTYIGRFAGKKDSTKMQVSRRTIGTYEKGIETIEQRLINEGKQLPGVGSVMSLKRARAIADEWTLILGNGIDPRRHEEELAARSVQAAAQQKAEDDRRMKGLFKNVVEDFISDLPNRKRNRHIAQDEREIRRELLQRNDKDGGAWVCPLADMHISEVSDIDIQDLVEAIRDRPAPGMAYNVLGHIKNIFTWAMVPRRRRDYGLEVDPTQHLRPSTFKLSKKITTRTLTDDEIRAYWAASDAQPYPLGQFHKLLMLTGQRKAEVSGARRREISAVRKLWTVPEERYKSGQEHIVPLSSDAYELVSKLPEFENKAHDCLFSTTNGEIPINGFSKAKAELDKAMLTHLRENDPDAQLPDWTYHDVRRTVRTRLSGLRINTDIAEMVIGHGKTGLERVYNHHTYEGEMREALERWASELNRIIFPEKHTNVVNLERASI